MVLSCHIGGSSSICVMANFLGRNSRRRRVLNEEALSASSAHLAVRDADLGTGESAPRYSDQAGVEHHPQVTDFLPRRYWSLGILAAIGAATTAAVEALFWFVAPVAAPYSADGSGPFDLQLGRGIASWLSAVLLLATAGVCIVVYSLRRHRIDDIRGRYRVWLAAAAACLALSVNCVAPLHALAAAVAAYHTGWTALREHAAWWLAAAGLPLGWIGLRAWLDARESRLAALALAAAFGSYGVAIAAYLAAWPANDGRANLLVTSSATLLGYWLLLVGAAAYGRFVVLDAQGLIATRTRRPKRPPQQSKKVIPAVSAAAVQAQAAAVPATSLRAFRQNLRVAAEQPASVSRWVDGREPVDDDYEDDGSPPGRKLSKAERKRLRKLKAQQRAA